MFTVNTLHCVLHCPKFFFINLWPIWDHIFTHVHKLIFFSLCLHFFNLLVWKPNLEKCSIYSSKFFHNFHWSKSNLTCSRLQASEWARRLILMFSYFFLLTRIMQCIGQVLITFKWFTGLKSLSLSPCCLNVEDRKERSTQKRSADTSSSYGIRKKRLTATADVFQVTCC
jgi:hypothetical protein